MHLGEKTQEQSAEGLEEREQSHMSGANCTGLLWGFHRGVVLWWGGQWPLYCSGWSHCRTFGGIRDLQRKAGVGVGEETQGPSSLFFNRLYFLEQF